MADDGQLIVLPQEIPHENLNDDIDKLKIVWMNEMNAPDILDFQGDLISDMVDQIQNQQSYVEEILADTAHLTEEKSFKNKLYQMEIDRIKYMIASYLRIRLHKIERYTRNALENSHNLSDGELNYAKEYKDLYENHCIDLVLSKLPDENLERIPLYEEPNINTFVFCEFTEHIGPTQLDDRGMEAPTILEKDSRMVLRYSKISSHLKNNELKLL